MSVTIAIVKHRWKVSKNAEMNASYMAKGFAKRRRNRYEKK